MIVSSGRIWIVKIIGGKSKVVAVIASPLQRAQETAAPIAAKHDLPVDTDPDLIESANFFEGRGVGPGDGAWRDPRFWWHLRNPFRPSWGEPYSEITDRMSTAADKARARGAGHRAQHRDGHGLGGGIARRVGVGAGRAIVE